MDFQELINNFLDSNIFQEGVALLQTAVMVVITYLLNKAKTKALELKDNANKSLVKYTEELNTLKTKYGITEEALQHTQDIVKDQTKKIEETNKDNKVLVQILSLFVLDSKSVAANTKLAVSKLLAQLTNQEVVEDVNVVIEESKEQEALTLEQVEEIKHESELQIEESNNNVESITQQTLDIYNELNNE